MLMLYVISCSYYHLLSDTYPHTDNHVLVSAPTLFCVHWRHFQGERSNCKFFATHQMIKSICLPFVVRSYFCKHKCTTLNIIWVNSVMCMSVCTETVELHTVGTQLFKAVGIPEFVKMYGKTKVETLKKTDVENLAHVECGRDVIYFNNILWFKALVESPTSVYKYLGCCEEFTVRRDSLKMASVDSETLLSSNW